MRRELCDPLSVSRYLHNERQDIKIVYSWMVVNLQPCDEETYVSLECQPTKAGGGVGEGEIARKPQID
jgi:hypothetical protein